MDGGTHAVQAPVVGAAVASESLCGIARGHHVCRTSHVKGLREDQSLPEGGLEITGNKGTEMTYIVQLEIRTIGHIGSIPARGAAQSGTKLHLLPIAETVTRLHKHGIGGLAVGIERLRILKVSRVHAQEHLVLGIAEDLAEV